MKGSVPVLDVLFPTVRATMLRLLFCSPPRQRYVRELMSLSGLALCTVQDELRKMSVLGLVTSWSNGYRRYYKADQGHPLFAPLLRIVQTSEDLPAAKHVVLHRKKSARVPKKWQQRRVTRLAADRPPKWGVFSHQTRRNT
jgi:predicted transcriptional regulator